MSRTLSQTQNRVRLLVNKLWAVGFERPTILVSCSAVAGQYGECCTITVTSGGEIIRSDSDTTLEALVDRLGLWAAGATPRNKLKLQLGDSINALSEAAE